MEYQKIEKNRENKTLKAGAENKIDKLACK